jgi:RNA polymerase sigma-70 factor, ECF subfamily
VTAFVANTLDLTPPRPAGTGTDTDRPGDRESAEVRGLLDRARTGDQAAFGHLIDLHKRAVYRTALAALGRPEDAEDAAQEAFLQAWRHLGGFRGEAAFRTWLLTIAWRKALDRRRARLLWWKRAAAAPEDRDLLADLTNGDPDPERSTLARDQARRVQREIARLSPRLRDTLLLAASGEHTYEDIAAMLGAPVGTVKWRVSEARRIITLRMDSCTTMD